MQKGWVLDQVTLRRRSHPEQKISTKGSQIAIPSNSVRVYLYQSSNMPWSGHSWKISCSTTLTPQTHKYMDRLIWGYPQRFFSSTPKTKGPSNYRKIPGSGHAAQVCNMQEDAGWQSIARKCPSQGMLSPVSTHPYQKGNYPMYFSPAHTFPLLWKAMTLKLLSWIETEQTRVSLQYCSSQAQSLYLK